MVSQQVVTCAFWPKTNSQNGGSLLDVLPRTDKTRLPSLTEERGFHEGVLSTLNPVLGIAQVK